MQLLVTLPSGATRCIVDVTCAGDVLRALGLSTNDSDCVLLAAGRLLARDEPLPAHVDHAQLLYSMRGGKGGFGAMLRGGPTGLRIKKTTNFDACRDLSGRRLRNARAEDELREWAAKQKEREDEKKAQLDTKHATRQARKQEAVAQFAQEAQKLQQSTATALQKGLQKLKSKAVADAAAAARREQRQVRTFFAGEEADEVDGEEEGETVRFCACVCVCLCLCCLLTKGVAIRARLRTTPSTMLAM